MLLLSRSAKYLPAVLVIAFLGCATAWAEEVATPGNPTAILHTSMGDIQLELFADKAPVSTQNFINYANSGFYENTVFHRVIGNFMIQGGGFTADLKQKPTAPPITNEADNGLSNKRGTVAMARTNDPQSATSQFFINVKDNSNLDYRGKSNAAGWGYAVFAKVTAGMDVVDQIRVVETHSVPPYSDVPVLPVVIERVEIIKPPQD
jgi:cyclophilin family peptidyl-prolyl cis-trans isomerase